MGGASSEVSDATRTRRARGRVLGPARHPARRQGARHAHRGLAPLRARRRSRGHRRRRPPASRTCSRRSAPAARGPGSSTRPAPRGPRASVRRCARARGRACWALPVPTRRAARDPDRPRLRAERRWRRARPHACRRGAATSSREVDLVEEVGRHYGLGKIPPRSRRRGGSAGCGPQQARERRLRELLVGAGLTEVINYAFVPDAAAGRPPRVALAEPALGRPGRAAQRRCCCRACCRRSARTCASGTPRRARFSSSGACSCRGAARPREERRLGILLSGGSRAAHWAARPRPPISTTRKALLELLAERLGEPAPRSRAGRRLPAAAPGQVGARLVPGGRELGFARRAAPRPARAARAARTRRWWPRSRSSRLLARRRAPALPGARPPPGRGARPVDPVRRGRLRAPRRWRARGRERAVGFARFASWTATREPGPGGQGQPDARRCASRTDERTLTGEEVQADVDGIVAASSAPRGARSGESRWRNRGRGLQGARGARSSVRPSG